MTEQKKSPEISIIAVSYTHLDVYKRQMPANDFPELPNNGAEETLTIKTGVLQDMIARTLYAVSQDEKKPAHTGELFEILPDKLTVGALDGYRLAIVERPVTAVKDKMCIRDRDDAALVGVHGFHGKVAAGLAHLGTNALCQCGQVALALVAVCNVKVSLEQKAAFEAGQAVKMENLQFRDGMKRSAYLQVLSLIHI